MVAEFEPALGVIETLSFGCCFPIQTALRSPTQLQSELVRCILLEKPILSQLSSHTPIAHSGVSFPAHPPQIKHSLEAGVLQGAMDAEPPKLCAHTG